MVSRFVCGLGAAGVIRLKDCPGDGETENAGPDGRSAEEGEGGEETCETGFVLIVKSPGKEQECDRKDGAGGLT